MLTAQQIEAAVGDTIFTLIFRKRKTGEIREMNCRLKVHAGVTGAGPIYDASKHNLITVFDMQIGEHRNVPLDGIMEIRAKGSRILTGLADLVGS